MKRILALILALCLYCFCCAAEPAESAETPTSIPSMWEEGQIHQIERKTFPLYIGTPDHLWPEEVPVYLVDGANDLPFLELSDFAAVLGDFLSSKEGGLENGGLTVSVNEEENTVIYLRKNSTMAAFNFKEKQIAWTDYLAFSQAEGSLYMNMLRGFRLYNSEGLPG